MRSPIFELRPAELESEGLLETLRKHVDVVRRVSSLDVELRGDGYEALPVEIEGQLLRIAQEALSNAVKHSQAGRVTLDLGAADGLVRLTVSDDGRGFDPDEPGIRGKRLGITSMEERAVELGGELTIESAPGRGTTIRLEAPVE